MEPVAAAVDSRTTPRQIDALRQVGDLVAQSTSLEVRVMGTGRTFESRPHDDPARGGIVSASGLLGENGIIIVQLEIARLADGVRVPPEPLFRQLAALGERVRVAAPRHEQPNGGASLWVELAVQATPMSLGRSSAFQEELKQIEDLAKSIMADMPTPWTDPELAALFKPVRKYLEPVVPWPGCGADPLHEARAWAEDTMDYLNGGSCIAVAAPGPATRQLGLAFLAHAGHAHHRALGQIKGPSIGPGSLVDMNGSSPEAITLVIPVASLSIGANLYDVADQIGPLVAALEAEKPVLFVGTLAQLQSVFHGGQGAACDPMVPIVRHVPDMSLDPLARFCVSEEGRRVGGLSPAEEDALAREVIEALQPYERAEQQRLMPTVSRRTVRRSRTTGAPSPPTAEFATKVSRLSETLGGLSVSPRATRSPAVQARFVHGLAGPEVLPYLQAQLVGQDSALQQLVAHLRKECLTRPAHQPIRYCAQGTPATGKSESAVLLASHLGVPYVNIDCASMSSYHQAAAQLLGSGRGIVGSYQSGRLEQIAKHHEGAVVEVSDMDHAHPSVRTALADLFLQVLETGEAQAAKGNMFSCANLILAFTMNLPHGMDEGVRQGLGFGGGLTEREVRARVIDEIKQMLSSAFLSRVGSPILFEPLDGPALATVLEQSILWAVQTAAERLQIRIDGVELEAGLGAKLLPALETSVTAFGARAVLELGRSLAANAIAAIDLDPSATAQRTLHVTADEVGRLSVTATRAHT